MVGWRAGTTGSRLAVLLLLALVHTATTATLQCPKGKLWTNEPLELQADCAQGDTCCKYDQSSKTYACGRGEACEGGDVCQSSGGEKCCAKEDGAGGFAFTQQACKGIWPLCPVGPFDKVKADNAEPYQVSEHGLCLYDYATKMFSVASPVNGKWPTITAAQEPCQAEAQTKGKMKCCATKAKGFEGFAADVNCADPSQKCPLAEGAESVPCADGSFTCCVMDGRGRTRCAKGTDCDKGKVCTPTWWIETSKEEKKCCLSKYGHEVVETEKDKDCPKKEPVKCPVEVAEDPFTVSCSAPGRTQCCVMNGRRKSKCFGGVDCQSELACYPEKGEKCCLDAAGEKVEAVKNTAKCSGPVKGLKCPVEVAEDPFTVPCDIYHAGGCCILDGRRRAKCFRDDYPEQYCRTKEACWPRLDKGEKCCLDAAGEKVEVVNQTTACPHRAFLLDWPPTPKPRCEDRGAVMKAECGALTTEEGAACARRVELCLEGEAVPAAEAAGKACDEAWAHCLHSHAKGPTAHPLLTAVLLLLLLPN